MSCSSSSGRATILEDKASVHLNLAAFGIILIVEKGTSKFSVRISLISASGELYDSGGHLQLGFVNSCFQFSFNLFSQLFKLGFSGEIEYLAWSE